MMVHGTAYEIDVTVTQHFRAAHSLPMRPELHHHDWEVEFTISGKINPATGMVCDMLELAEFFKPFVSTLDNTVLHDVDVFSESEPLIALTAKYPTCDTLAHYFMWKTVPAFRDQVRIEGLTISKIMVKIAEPDQHEPWGWAIIRAEGVAP